MTAEQEILQRIVGTKLGIQLGLDVVRPDGSVDFCGSTLAMRSSGRDIALCRGSGACAIEVAAMERERFYTNTVLMWDI